MLRANFKRKLFVISDSEHAHEDKAKHVRHVEEKPQKYLYSILERKFFF